MAKMIPLGLVALFLLRAHVALPAVAGAAPAVTVSPAPGPRGTATIVSVGGLTPSTTHLVQLVRGVGNTNTVRVFEAAGSSDARRALTYRLVVDQEPGAYTVRIVAPGGTVLATAPFTVTGGGATPTLTLTPDSGPCGTSAAMQGHGFPGGSTITISREQTEPAGRPVGGPHLSNQVTANAGGDTIPFTVGPLGDDCGIPARATPVGTRYTFIAVASGPGVPAQHAPTARAAFTITGGTGDARTFPETGFSVRGRLLAYWRGQGLDLGDPAISERESLALFGYPISKEFVQTLEDGKTYRVQYFERARMEHHPEHAGTPYAILLGQFGRRILAAVPDAPTAPVAPQPGMTHFAATGHNVGPRFHAYWRANGGLEPFGYPLTEPFDQRLEDGKSYTVQYFERVRFELHPENPAPYQVELGQFGRLILGPTGGPNLP